MTVIHSDGKTEDFRKIMETSGFRYSGLETVDKKHQGENP